MPIYDIKSNRDGDIVPLFARFIRGLAGFYFARILETKQKSFWKFCVTKEKRGVSFEYG